MIHINTKNPWAMNTANVLLQSIDVILQHFRRLSDEYKIFITFGEQKQLIYQNTIERLTVWLPEANIITKELRSIPVNHCFIFLPFKKDEDVPPYPRFKKDNDIYHQDSNGFKTNPVNWNKGLGLL